MTGNLRSYLNETANISDTEFEKAIPYFSERILLKGQYFVKQGSICQQIAFVEEGLLRTYFLNNKAEEITFCFEPESNFATSYKSFILQCPSNVSIQAIEKTKLIIIHRQNLQKLYDSSYQWLKIGKLFAEKEYIFLEQYASMLNTESAKEKYQRLLEQNPTIIQRVKLKYIASYLGITSRTLSRIRKEI